MKYLLSKIIVVAQESQDTTPTSDLVDGVKKYINQHFNLELSNRQIATQFGYHPYYLSSLFRKYEGSTMHQYIASVRMQKARELLLSTNKTVYEIAEECGFSGAAYFSEFFMKHQRITPTEYRERCK